MVSVRLELHRCKWYKIYLADLGVEPEGCFILESELDVEIRWLLAFVTQSFGAAAGDAAPDALACEVFEVGVAGCFHWKSIFDHCCAIASATP